MPSGGTSHVKPNSVGSTSLDGYSKTRYKRPQSLIQNHKRQEHSESAVGRIYLEEVTFQ